MERGKRSKYPFATIFCFFLGLCQWYLPAYMEREKVARPLFKIHPSSSMVCLFVFPVDSQILKGFPHPSFHVRVLFLLVILTLEGISTDAKFLQAITGNQQKKFRHK